MNSISVILLAAAVAYATADTFGLGSIHPLGLSDDTRIVNGANATTGQFPHQVSLRHKGRHFCGGSIITDRWILTAAHCTKGRDADEFVAVVGALLLSEGGVEHELSVNHPHPSYSRDGDDIALIQTKEAIVFDEVTKPIALPTANTDGGLEAIISGWGVVRANDREVPNHMQFLETTTLTPRQCKSRLPHVYVRFDDLVCHLNPKGGACFGDSGKANNVPF